MVLLDTMMHSSNISGRGFVGMVPENRHTCISMDVFRRHPYPGQLRLNYCQHLRSNTLIFYKNADNIRAIIAKTDLSSQEYCNSGKNVFKNDACSHKCNKFPGIKCKRFIV